MDSLLEKTNGRFYLDKKAIYPRDNTLNVIIYVYYIQVRITLVLMEPCIFNEITL